MALRLYGFIGSIYYSIVKATLLEKGVEFEEVPIELDAAGRFDLPPGYLRKSPMGKVPCLETPHGFLSETSVIIDYLEDLGQGPSFYPADPFEKARVRALVKHIELYLELPARRLYGEFFGRPVSVDEKREVRELLEKGFAALVRIGRFEPHLAGHAVTYADFFAQFALTAATRTTKAVYGWDTYNEIPGIRGLLRLVGERESMKKIAADRRAARQSASD